MSYHATLAEAEAYARKLAGVVPEPVLICWKHGTYHVGTRRQASNLFRSERTIVKIIGSTAKVN